MSAACRIGNGVPRKGERLAGFLDSLIHVPRFYDFPVPAAAFWSAEQGRAGLPLPRPRSDRERLAVPGLPARLPVPLHIVLLDYRDITHPEAGGAEQYVNEIFQRIAACGHRVTLVCAGYAGAPVAERIGGLRVLRTGNKATANVAVAYAALALARHEPVDLFVEDICKLPFLLPALTRIPVLPIVLHLFGTTVFAETNPLFASYVWLFERLIPTVYHGLRFVALSASTVEDLTRRGVRAGAMDVVPPGVDLRRYAAPEVRDGRPLLVYVGRLKRYKQLDVVVRAFARARAQVPGAELVLVGKGDDRARLEALVRHLRLGEAVRFTGYLAEAEKLVWLRRACAVVYPSQKEGWGIATIEAAACGTPVLASDAPGLRDAVRDGVTGFLIPHDDVDAWSRRMTEVLLDARLCARLGAAARDWARGFDWDRAADKMRAVVEQVAGRAAESGGH